jgi:hypothetical protein
MLWCFYLSFTPFWGAAQTPSGDGYADPSGGGSAGSYDGEAADPSGGETGPSNGGDAGSRGVALMTFVGDDLSVSGELQVSVNGEIQNLGGYTIQPVSAEELPESLGFPPDEPPAPVYLGESELALTGEYYIDADDVQHFQLWLWNSDAGSLVATEEMVFEDMEEAHSYLPAIISWLFSREREQRAEEERIASRAATRAGPRVLLQTVVSNDQDGNEQEQVREPFTRRIFLGLRGGGSFNTLKAQDVGNYEAGSSQWFGGEGALMAEFRLFRFLSLQAEAVFIYDLFMAAKKVQQGGVLIRSGDTFRSMLLAFPLYAKIPLETGGFSLSPFMGLYYLMPLGQMAISPAAGNGGGGSYPYGIIPPLGLSLGIDVGLPLGPGEMVAGLRFDQNIGMTIVQDPNMMQYYRNRINLSFGYQFLLWKKQRKQ